jgi:hypothetical protein
MSEINYFSESFKFLNEELLSKLKILYIFKDYFENINAIIVTNCDKVQTFGSKSLGVLGLGNWNEVKELTINEELSNKQIIDFDNGFYHVVGRTIDGKIFCWGYNGNGVLGNGTKNDLVYKPLLNEFLSEKLVIDISCGALHTLVLTKKGEVYGWGQIWNGSHGIHLISAKINESNDQKVVMISSGYYHSIALTENGRVFSWNFDDSEQPLFGNAFNSKIPSTLRFSMDILIKKISCTREFSLLLSRNGDIYFFINSMSESHDNPKKIFVNANKFIDIAAHSHCNIFVALSENGIYYIWGECGGKVIEIPKKSEFSSLNEIFKFYCGTTYKTFKRKNYFYNLFPKDGKLEKEFSILGYISQGQYGVVFKAFDKLSYEISAIKIIPIAEKDLNKNLKSKESNFMEVSKSIFVVDYFQSWIEKSGFFRIGNEIHSNSENNPALKLSDPQKPYLLLIQTELCYETLKQVIKDKNLYYTLTPLEYYISSELFKEILEGVSFLHNLKPPIIHRDLKPANILLTNGLHGRFIKIGDFGLATFHPFDGQSHTKYVGTIGYVAPEVMNTTKYDLKADIYSLGVIGLKLFNINIDE